MIPAMNKRFKILADGVVELDTENLILKNKVGEYDQERLIESRKKPLEKINVEENADHNMGIMKK